MTHAGRSVIVSGSTVAIGLLSMLVIPLPFIRSIGLGGMLIPAVSVLSSITLLPAMLAMLGPRINRGRVMPKKFVEPHPAETGIWWRWSRLVMRRSGLVFAAGVAIVALVLIPAFQINPSDAELKNEPAKGDALAGRDAIATAGMPAGVSSRTSCSSSTARRRRCSQRRDEGRGRQGHRRRDGAEGVADGGTGLVEAFGEEDANSRDAKKTISRLQHDVLPKLESSLGAARASRSAAVGPEGRDFIKAVYGKFPYVVLFVLILTYLLLMRAFRSIVLPLKAVLLNLVSLGAAYGIVVFIFQQGHGSDAIWGVQATDSIISWIPLMIFAFLYGISMDYEVFMLTRIREEYDETGDTPSGGRARPRAHGQARHERGGGADARVLLALDRARPRHQAVRDRARRRGHLRRDRDPRAARAVDDAAARPLELDLPAARRATVARRATRRDAARRRHSLKREDEHELGAFKWRGASAVLDALRPDAVVTASTGNHGAATAWAAKQAGIRAIVFVPRDASAAKVALIQAQGAELYRVGADMDEAKAAAREYAAAQRPVLLRGRQRAGAVRRLRGDRRRAARRAARAGRRRRPGRERRARDRRLPGGRAARAERAPRRRRRGRGAGDVGELARGRAGRLRPLRRPSPTGSPSASRSRSPSPS